MLTCTFFGHRDCPDCMETILKKVVIDLIERKSVDSFVVGNAGRYDAIVQKVLKDLRISGYIFNCQVVLSKIPNTNMNSDLYFDTLLPCGVEEVPPRFAIDYVNNYMLDVSDFVVTYVIRSFGGAAKFEQKALKSNKTVINISEIK